MELKRSLLLVAVPAALLLGTASVIAASPTPSRPATHAAQPAVTHVTKTPSRPATHAAQPAEAPDPVEAPDAKDAPEAPGAANVGHADNPADANADHQFDGQE